MAKFEGVIFDVDGVLVDSPHERAWREALRELMLGPWAGVRERTTWSPEAFTSAVYQQLVSGRPRLDGARAVLDHFHVPDRDERVLEYADRKQSMIVRLIDEREFTAYPDALRFVVDVKQRGLRIAAASSSKNAAHMLQRIDIGLYAHSHGVAALARRSPQSLYDLLDADVSGRDFAHGKPHPEMFLTAARELGVDPDAAVVVEDASAGVAAAVAGGMCAIGVARMGEHELLAASGADLVVTSLDEVDRDALLEGSLRALTA
jgi:beta-phosphoglucomutase-like phosphatase (HAD superfamily)